MRILICHLVHRQKTLAEYKSFQLFKSLVTRDIHRSHCRKGCCRCLWEVFPLLSGIHCPHLIVASPSRCHVRKPRTVRNIKSIPPINVIMLGNVSAWAILSIRYLLICVLSASGTIQILHVPHVSVAMGSNFCPLNKVRLLQMHMVLAWFALRSASCCCQMGKGGPKSGFSRPCFSVGGMALSPLMRATP